MNDGQRNVCVDLPAERHLTLDNARGTPLQVTRGTVWITQERSYDDVILQAGDRWVVERSGRTVIQAQNDASVCLAVRPGAWRQALRRQWARWCAGVAALRRLATRGRRHLRSQRSLPYY
ncbi:MAG: DUF2917 domain-containing protein [Casimicrobiaceae bacterium]